MKEARPTNWSIRLFSTDALALLLAEKPLMSIAGSPVEWMNNTSAEPLGFVTVESAGTILIVVSPPVNSWSTILNIVPLIES